jgi:hypothetical protein
MLDPGVRLQLLVGPTVPVPAPYEVVDSLVELEVRNDDQQRDGFQMTFSLGRRGTALDYGLLRGGLLDPPNRVIIMVIIGVLPQVLIDGLITNHQVVPREEPGQSRLVVTGEDISLQLDLEEKSTTHPNQPDSVIVTKIVASYGLVPQVTPTTDVPIETDRVPTQQGTDLAYVQQLAQRNSFVFYVEPTMVPTVNAAYWGPQNRLGLPQSALTMNMGSANNVEQLSFGFDALQPAEPQVSILEPFTGLTIPIPVPSLPFPGLSARAATPMRQTVQRDTANLNPIQAALRALAGASGSGSAATASGVVDTARYRRVLRARQLVGVRGAGETHDGTYYVQRVTHRIKRGEYKQQFTLTREGRGASSPMVVP